MDKIKVQQVIDKGSEIPDRGPILRPSYGHHKNPFRDSRGNALPSMSDYSLHRELVTLDFVMSAIVTLHRIYCVPRIERDSTGKAFVVALWPEGKDPEMKGFYDKLCEIALELADYPGGLCAATTEGAE